MRKQLLLSCALILLSATAWAQPLNISGHRAVLDTLNNTWLCSVPQSIFGTDFQAVVSYGDDVIDLTIEGATVASGDEFTFANVEGGKYYEVTAQLGDSLFTGTITFTWLPVVELTGDIGMEYIYGDVIVNDPDSAYAEPMKAKLKWRGRATNTPDKNKRNYSIKFVNEDSTKLNRRFFGLRNDNHWHLDAGQMDFLRVRNRLNADLWMKMARRPWYADTFPNARSASRGKIVEVIVNSEYRGIYSMSEPIDRKQLKLKKYDQEGSKLTFHGALWDSYTWTRTVTMSDPADRTPGARLWDGFELDYPKWNETRQVTWNTLENAVRFAKRADTIPELRDSMGYYFDLPVMQDYYIFIVTIQAQDNESNNIFYACRDFRDNPRLTMFPWDLGISLGQNYSPEVDHPEMVSPECDPSTWISHIPMIIMMSEKNYRDEVLARYRELRQTTLNTDSLVNHYRTAIDNLLECGAATREENRWSGDTDLAGKELNLDAEMNYIEDWIRRRMAYLDEYVFIEKDTEIIGDVNGDGEVNIADINTLIDIILGGQVDDATMKRADVNKDKEVNIADVNSVLDIILR